MTMPSERKRYRPTAREATLRRATAHRLWRDGLDLGTIAKLVSTETRPCTVDDVKYDIWCVVKNAPEQVARRMITDRGECLRYFYEVEARTDEAPDEPERGPISAVAALAYDDLVSGKPCTLGASMDNSGRNSCSVGRDGVYHTCAPAAFEWLTSDGFWCLAESLRWNWEEHMAVVLRLAAETMAMFPFVSLVPALVWRIACTLQGTAGGIGYSLRQVADGMLCRKRLGQSWDQVLEPYYDVVPQPSSEAMALAVRMLDRPWQPSGKPYAYPGASRPHAGQATSEKAARTNWQSINLSSAPEMVSAS